MQPTRDNMTTITVEKTHPDTSTKYYETRKKLMKNKGIQRKTHTKSIYIYTYTHNGCMIANTH